MVWKGTKHTHPTKDEHGFSLLELVVSVGVVLVLTMVGIVSYNNLSGSSKQSATQKAADEVYGKAFSALLDSDAATKPEDVAEEYNKSSKNVVTTVDVLPAGGIKVTATLGDDYFAVRETPVSAGSDGNSSIEQPTDGTIISSNTHKTIMNFQCNRNVNGFLPIVNMPGNGKATWVNMSTNEETVLNNIENTTNEKHLYIDQSPQTVLPSVNMEADVPYQLTVEAEVDSATSPFNPETSFAIMTLDKWSFVEQDTTVTNCLTSIDSIGNGIAGISTYRAHKLESVPLAIPSTVTSLKHAFNAAAKFDQDISSWNVSNVTDMSFMFSSAKAFNNGNQPLDWGEKTANVTNMSSTFANAQAFNQDVSSWNVSNVTNMSSTFVGAYVFNQDISSWDVSNVTNMSQMFYLALAFNQDVNPWDVSNVTNMSSMFYDARAFNNGNQPLDWGEKTAKVTNMRGMFGWTPVFNQDISGWNVSNVTDMHQMFHKALVFNQDISGWDVSNVTDMSLMFSYTQAFDNGGQPLDWNEKTGNVTNMYQIFNYTEAFNQDISNWDVSNVTNMSNMFSTAQAFNQDISDWNVSNVTNMSNMFYDADAFNNGNQPLDWGDKTANVTNMSRMFNNAHVFDQDISSWDVSNVTNMSYMFQYAVAFNNGNQPLDWGEKTANVTNMIFMFQHAQAFNQDISGWKVPKIAKMPAGFVLNSGIQSNTQYHPKWGVA